jgi:hypothetical protein
MKIIGNQLKKAKYRRVFYYTEVLNLIGFNKLQTIKYSWSSCYPNYDFKFRIYKRKVDDKSETIYVMVVYCSTTPLSEPLDLKHVIYKLEV